MARDKDEEQRPALTMPDFSKIDASKLAPALGMVDSTAKNLVPAEFSNRTWGQQISYYAGVSYLGGGVGGGLFGLYKGLSSGKQLPNLTLKTNAVINNVSKSATSKANMLGVLGIMYISYSHLFASGSHKKTSWHNLAAAVCSGATYYSLGGVKATITGAFLGGVVFGAYSAVAELPGTTEWLK
jgi:import inner membrane translocase subunit TIM23